MDPVTLIVAALVAGASSGLKDTATEAVKDAYAGFKSLLRRHFGSTDTSAPSLVDHSIAAVEQDHSANTAQLRDELARSDAQEDRALVEAASKLLATLDPQGARDGRYDVTISDSKGIVVHNEGAVTMNFGDRD